MSRKDITPFWRQLFVVCGPFLSSMGHGCCMSFSATLLPLIMDPSSDIFVTSNMASWIASIIVVGTLTGTTVSPLVMDKVGRKNGLFLSTVPPLIGWYGIGCAQSATVLLLAKLLQGLGMGVAFVICPVFVGEITTPKYRGAFSSLLSLGLTLGILSGHFVGSIFPWRTAAFICSIFHVLTFLISPFLSESPSWLASENKFNESEKAFSWLRGDSEAALKEFNAMVLAQKMRSTKENMSSNKACGRNFLTRLTNAAFYKPLAIMLTLCLVFHCTGLDVVLNAYCIIILKLLLDDTEGDINYHQIMLSFDIIKLVASVLSIYLIKVFNRRTYVITVNLLVTIALVLLVIFSYLKALRVTFFYSNWIILALLGFFTFFLYVGTVAVLLPVGGEIFPMAYKSMCMSALGLISSFMLFATLKLAPAMLAGLGLHGTFLAYALVGAFSTLYLYVFLPETSGKTLQEIEEYFTGDDVGDMRRTCEMDAMVREGVDEHNK